MVIVGSGPAGVSAAEAFRQHNPDEPIRIITDDPALPYERPPLSKEFLRGDAEPADTELHPAAWFNERSIELIQAVGVQAINVAGRHLTADGNRYPYRWLVLACGAKPSPFPVPGGDAALQLRSLADARLLREAAVKAGSAVVIGAGFGENARAALVTRGLAELSRLTVFLGGRAETVELSPRDREICARIGPLLRERGLLFVGIDVIGDWLTEINVTSPTGLQEIVRFGGPDLAAAIWDKIEAKRG